MLLLKIGESLHSFFTATIMPVLLLDEMAPIAFAMYLLGFLVCVPLYGTLLVSTLASGPTSYRVSLFFAGALVLLERFHKLCTW